MNIKEFKAGNIITRYEPSASHWHTGNRDGSYMTKDMKLIGIDGNIIHLEDLEETFTCNSCKLNISQWSEGWQMVTMGKNAKQDKALSGYLAGEGLKCKLFR